MTELSTQSSAEQASNTRQWLRLVIALSLALIVSFALFRMMLSLISHQSPAHAPQPPPILVDTKRPKELPSQSAASAKPQAPVEPTLSDIALPSVNTVPVVQPDIQLDEPQLELSADVSQLTGQQENWVQPSAGTGGDGAYYGSGDVDAGIRDVVPAATQRPNIPKLAWDNKIDGWVLVTFSINAKGHVGDVQVLNAQPRGVFEANAVAAVKGWRYMPLKKANKRYISQKIEFRWKDYPMNIGEY